MRCLVLPLIFASAHLFQLEKESLLFRSEEIAKVHAEEIAKAPPPPIKPQTTACLTQSSIWYSADLSALGDDPLQALSQKDFWNLLQHLGVDGVDLRVANIPREALERYQAILNLAQEREISLIGHPLIHGSYGDADFELAIRAYKSYPHLYHLIEIEKGDWPLLPKARQGDVSASIPMSTVQAFKQLGYLDGRPDILYPNTRSSCWAATAPIMGCDSILRRWIYLQFPDTTAPAYNWLDPTFASQRVASGETLNALFRLEQTILCFDSYPLLCRQMAGLSPSDNALESLALLVRKLGGFSAIRQKTSIEESKKAGTDLLFDSFTRPAVLHALLTGDAEALRLMYQIFLQEELQPRRMIHELRPYCDARCEWDEFLLNPKATYQYYEERITGELLAERLLKEDLYALGQPPSLYTPPIAPLFGLCRPPFSWKDLEEHRDELQKAHLLTAFFYAMQPGVFSFSALDVRGAGGADPMKGPGLYYPLSRQLKNENSFATHLKQMLKARKGVDLHLAELAYVLPTRQKGLIILVHRLPLTHQYCVTAVNFSRSYVQETIHHPILAKKWAINLITEQSESKLYGSDTFDLKLEPLSGKAFLLKAKPYSQ